MISQVIQATKVDWNAKKRPPKSSKTEMLIFGLHSTSDDRPSDPSGESQSKCKKNEMLFQLVSSVVSVRVFCCFSVGLLYAPPPTQMAR